MIQMTLAQAMNILGQTGHPLNISFQGISIDTRSLQAGNLFIAIPGQRVDGHDFIEIAREKGAVAALVTHPVESNLPQIQVDDISLALGQLSAAWRNQFDIPIVAITGSNGKTTLKNMVTAIITAACDGDETAVLATQGNLNNHIGLPLTLCRLNAAHRYAVIEMGMSHFGEIEYLTKLTRPQVAIINNAAAAHIEGVGDIAGVARAKAEIFSGLSKNGVAILNRDDAFFTYWLELIAEHAHLSFGLHPDADISASLPKTLEIQKIKLHTAKGDIEIALPLLGPHNIKNALAAAAAAQAINIDLAAIKAGLESIQAAPGRLELHTLANGVKVIDDTYNANPFSLQAAINTLVSFAGKKILVLGDMKELGHEAKTLHQLAGQTIKQAGIDYLFTYGDLSAHAALAFGDGAYHFNEQDKLVSALKPFLHQQTTILVKGSRSMRMEKVVSGLMT